MLNRTFKGYGVELRPIIPFDLPVLRRWRNSNRIRFEMLDTSYITPKQQRRWYETTKARNNEAHWTVWCNDVRAGYMNIKGAGAVELQTSLDGGLYVGDSVVKHGLLGYAIALMQLEIVLEYLDTPEYKTSFRETNRSARKFNEQLGYRELEKRNGFIWVSITRQQHEPAKKKLMKFFQSKTNNLGKAK